MGTYRFGDFEVVPAERRLLHCGQPLPVTPKVFETLLVLLRASGRVVSKEELVSAVWPDTFVDENNLNKNISLLRKLLGNATIETVPKLGYRFAAQILEGDTGPPVRRARRRRIIIPASIAFVVTAFVITAAISEKPHQIRSLAVLPFRSLNTTNDPYLGLGIADTLISRLGSASSLTVRSTEAVERFDGSGGPALDAGRQLRVDAVIDGHLQRSGRTLRATVQLIRTVDGKTLWSDSFDAATDDPLSLEDAISTALLTNSPLHELLLAPPAVRHPQTRDPAAYESYLKGRYFWNKRTRPDLNEAVNYLTDAVRRDPNFALAWSALADGYALEGQHVEAARHAARHALVLDPSLAQPHACLGLLALFNDWNFIAAERELRRSIELDDRYATAHHWYAFYLVLRGRDDDALREIERARQLDPLSLIINTDIGQILYLSGRFPEAIAAYRKALDLDPTYKQAHNGLAEAYAASGMCALAARELHEYPDLLLAAHYGAREYWRALLKDLINSEGQSYREAQAAARAGNSSDAIAFLTRAHQIHDGELLLATRDPAFDRLRSDPRFRQLIP